MFERFRPGPRLACLRGQRRQGHRGRPGQAGAEARRRDAVPPVQAPPLRHEQGQGRRREGARPLLARAPDDDAEAALDALRGSHGAALDARARLPRELQRAARRHGLGEPGPRAPRAAGVRHGRELRPRAAAHVQLPARRHRRAVARLLRLRAGQQGAAPGEAAPHPRPRDADRARRELPRLPGRVLEGVPRAPAVPRARRKIRRLEDLVPRRLLAALRLV
mmetsp:Transcript_4005/g.13706  ORF Transcript_4005/g.13706 Transcript_4005/m.13706 type:complete len:221 (+) Transcript_4005:418-1080(+)